MSMPKDSYLLVALLGIASIIAFTVESSILTVFRFFLLHDTKQLPYKQIVIKCYYCELLLTK